MELLPEHGSCFVCGKSNPMSVGITWQLEPGNQISAFFEFSEFQQGPPGFVHGGASAAVLDEAMGLSIWNCGYRAVTVNLNINYHKPIPLDEPVQIQANMNSKITAACLLKEKFCCPMAQSPFLQPASM